MKYIFGIFSYLLYLLDIDAIEVATHMPKDVEKLLKTTRRIINGQDVVDGRPYMVYLRLPKSNVKVDAYHTWLCGGVIVHEDYILTSAACIEDVEHFYVVSGTYKYAEDDDKFTNPCIKNGAKKAIWKCVPKNYVFDGHENDNIRWMNNDIAVIKIEEGFNFNRRIRGCDFIPKPIGYNNQSKSLENPGTVCSIAGWGSKSKYSDWINRRLGIPPSRRTGNQNNLQEGLVEIIAKNKCKRRWGSRYTNIIENYMICSKDVGETMTDICNEKYVDCEDITYSAEENNRRYIVEKVPKNLVMHSGLPNDTGHRLDPKTRRSKDVPDGGFCENDHGGPLIYGEGGNSLVIGIISACLVKERSNKCYGPFLYTSVYKNRQFISCAIYKEVQVKCRRQFRSGYTHDEVTISWKNHPDGPAKNELVPKKEDPKHNTAVQASVSAAPIVVTQVAPIAPVASVMSKIPEVLLKANLTPAVPVVAPVNIAKIAPVVL